MSSRTCTPSSQEKDFYDHEDAENDVCEQEVGLHSLLLKCARWIEGEESNIVWPAERSETMLNPRTCSLSWPEEIDGEEVSVVSTETDDQAGRT